MERSRHFLLFLFAYKALTDRINTNHGQSLSDNGGVSLRATHQIDAGLRSKDLAYYQFDPKDAKVIEQTATACGRTDASHYCNLGLEARFQAKCASFATKEIDEIAFDLYEALKAFCGNTKQLPQRVNIGPDRVIDKLHGVLALIMLNGTPPITPDNLQTYLAEAVKAMTTYRDGHAKKGNHGIVACTNAYIGFYNKSRDVDDMWTVVTGNVYSECIALKLPLTAYLKAR